LLLPHLGPVRGCRGETLRSYADALELGQALEDEGCCYAACCGISSVTCMGD